MRDRAAIPIAGRALLSDRNVGPLPPELMLGCFVVAGLIVTIVYSIDWSSVF
jgi:hypothetical protein